MAYIKEVKIINASRMTDKQMKDSVKELNKKKYDFSEFRYGEKVNNATDPVSYLGDNNRVSLKNKKEIL